MPEARHIFLVDDEEAIVYVFRRYLERAGYRVSTFCRPDEALAAASRGAIDLLVTDYRMPGMNGVELIERLRAPHPGLPAVIVTAYGAEVNADAVDIVVLRKPVTMQAFLEAVARRLSGTADLPPPP